MKIEWLNSEATIARVTRGLFRKRVAIVELLQIGLQSEWRYVATLRGVGYGIECQLEETRLRYKDEKNAALEWQRLSRLPRATTWMVKS